MSGRKRFEIKKNQNSSFGLNITSMTDMFTILLVFLLQTYSTQEVQIIPEKGLNLPISSSEKAPAEALQIHISPTVLKVGERTIASLNSGEFTSQDLDTNDSNFIKPLFQELDKLMKEKKLKNISEGQILMMADQNLSYQQIRKVMYTASMAGFPKLKMATVAGE